MRSKTLPTAMLFGMALSCGAAQTQAQPSVFAAYAKPLRISTATHVLELRLEALTAAPRIVESRALDDRAAGQGGEEQDGPPIPLLALFAGSLAATDGELLQELEADLNDVRWIAETGNKAVLNRAVKDAQKDIVQARHVLVPAQVRNDPAFQAAVIAKLAISGWSFGEGYEEAASGETSAYPLAWLTLRRARTLWTQLKPRLNTSTGGAEHAFDQLSTLMPTIRPPARFSDPEDVEGAALDLVFALESALGRPILVRGFAPALHSMRQQAAATCDAVSNGRGRLALEQALAGRITYGTQLASTLATLAPDVHHALSAMWTELDTLRAAKTVGAQQTCDSFRNAVSQAVAVFG